MFGGGLGDVFCKYWGHVWEIYGLLWANLLEFLDSFWKVTNLLSYLQGNQPYVVKVVKHNVFVNGSCKVRSDFCESLDECILLLKSS